MQEDTAFNRAEEIFEEFVAQPGALDHSSPEYQECRQLAIKIFARLEPLRKRFVEACLGKSNDNMLSRKAMSFPHRFMKAKSAQEVSVSNLQRLQSLIEDSVNLGLLCHLMWFQFPTRGNLDVVNLDDLFSHWATQSLAADQLCRDYDKEFKGLPSAVQNSYSSVRVEPILKREFNMGLWDRSKANSWFRNTFFAGIRLGMLHDVATNKSYGQN